MTCIVRSPLNSLHARSTLILSPPRRLQTIKEHGLILEKVSIALTNPGFGHQNQPNNSALPIHFPFQHDTAGVAVEEAVEKVADKMHSLETSMATIGNNYSTMSATLSNKILSWQMNVVADLEKKLGEDINSLTSAQDSLDSRLNVFRETVNEKMIEVKSEMEKQLSSSGSSAEQELKMSKLVQQEVNTLEERLIKKQVSVVKGGLREPVLVAEEYFRKYLKYS